MDVKKVLVIDDDKIVCTYCSEILNFSFGFNVDCAYNFKDFKDFFKSNTYDLIILDLYLEDALGIEILKEIKEKSPDIIVIIISGIGNQNDSIESLKLGADEYIQKPFSRNEFIEKIKIVLKRKEKQRKTKEEITKKVIKDKLIKNELSIARKLIKNFLPSERIVFGELSFLGFDFQSKDIGGDFYNYYWLDENNLLFYIGDISNRGITSSIIASIVIASIDSIIQFKKTYDPMIILRELNKILFRHLDHKSYVSIFLGILNIEKQKLNYANAGHLPLIIIRNNKIIKLENSGKVLGIFEDWNYKSYEFEYKYPDILFAFSDGFLNLLNSKGIFDENQQYNYIKNFFYQRKNDNFEKINQDLINIITNNKKKLDDDIVTLYAKNFYTSYIKKYFCFTCNMVYETNILQNIESFFKNTLKIKKSNQVYEIMYCLREAINNSVIYGYKKRKNGLIEVTIYFNKENQILEIILQDYGVGFFKKDYKKPDFKNKENIMRISGRGIYILNQMMDKVWISSYLGRGTQIIMRKKLND